MSSKIKTKLDTKTVDNFGKVKSRTVTYANPDASNYTLSNGVKVLNSLSNNTLQSITRVDRQNITDAVEE